MCGRFVLLSDKDNAEIERILRDIAQKYGPGAFDGSCVQPGDGAPVYAAKNSRATAELMTWGYPKYDGEGLVYNARSETAAQKRLFAQSLRLHRCVVPATGFFEGHKEKKGERLFRLEGEAVLYLAGLYRPSGAGERARFVLLTTKANACVSPYHHRMPLLLEKALVRPWLFAPQEAARLLNTPQPPLLAEPA